MATTPFPSDLFDYLNNHTLVGIKGGRERKGFLNIWMVEVDGGLFSRSWNKSSKSWFTEFQRTGIGEIKYKTKVLKVRGNQLPFEDPQQDKINEAYLKKYDQPENLPYSRGITQPEYRNYTMEFFIEPNQE
jgi:hypothetical protein